MLLFIILPSLYCGVLTYLSLSTTNIDNKTYRLLNIFYRISLISLRIIISSCAYYIYNNSWLCEADNRCNILTNYLNSLCETDQDNCINRYLIVRLLFIYAMVEISNIFILQLKNYNIRTDRIFNSITKIVIYLIAIHNPTQIITTYISLTFVTDTIKDILLLLKIKLFTVSIISYIMTLAIYAVMVGLIKNIEYTYDWVPFSILIANMLIYMIKK